MPNPLRICIKPLNPQISFLAQTGRTSCHPSRLSPRNLFSTLSASIMVRPGRCLLGMKSTFTGKQWRTRSEPTKRCYKSQYIAAQRPGTSTDEVEGLYKDKIAPLPISSVSSKRRASFCDEPPTSKRAHLYQESRQGSPVKAWLSGLPECGGFQHLDQPEIVENNQPPFERPWSRSWSRDKKQTSYQDSNYDVVLECKGSFNHPSARGMVDEDEKLGKKLLTTAQPVPNDVLFDDNHFESFFSNLLDSSKLRVYMDVHPRIVPSVENLSITGRKEFDCFIEAHNDLWTKCVPFYGPRPQPDHTIGFKLDNFTEQQRRKLGIDPAKESYYTAREDIYFPFFTSEVKCGKQSLEFADRPNAHSMTVAMRGMVEVFRRCGRAADMHRRLAGVSILHDGYGARIYAHYPEIDNDNVTYWRSHPEGIFFRSDSVQERWRCYQITLNVCQMFGLPLLQRLKDIVDELPELQVPSVDLTVTPEDTNVQSSQQDSSVPDSQEKNSRKPQQRRGVIAELRSMIENLQQQLEQQRKDTKDRETALLAQIEQQRKDKKDSETGFMKFIQHQSEQISRLPPK